MFLALVANMFIYESNPISDLNYRMDTFSGGIGFRGNLLERLVDSFWGSPILLPTMRTDVFAWSEEVWHTIIDMDFYHGWWQYVFAITLVLLVGAAFLMNWKNKFVILLACLFGVDLIIHLGLAYGTKSLFLYGSHWVYIIPMVLGWMYVKLNNKLKKVFNCMMVGLIIILVINNAVYLNDFFQLAIKYFSTPSWGI